MPRQNPFFYVPSPIPEQALGPTHLNVATNLNNMAELYRVQGKVYRGRAPNQRALAIRNEALGSPIPMSPRASIMWLALL